jgi:AcrR family transcriptional regulator
MRLFLSFTAVFALAAPAAAKDPLRFMPESTDVVIKVEEPRAFLEALLHHDLAKEAQSLQVVRDFLDSTDARRFFQLVTHYEKELATPWPEMIDRLAGGGMAAGLKYRGENAPALIVIQGTDEKAVAKFFDMSLALFEEELARQGAKEKPLRKAYAGMEYVQLAEQLLAARVGDAILLATKRGTIEGALDQHVANGKDPKARNMATAQWPKDAAKLLPPNPAISLVVNLKPVKELPEAKDLFVTPRNDVVQTVLFAGYLDVARRSDYLAAGLYHDAGDFRLAVRMPAGRDGMATDVELHLPRDPKVGGSLPLLEPKGVLFSHSFYLDLDTLYKKREAILPAQVAKDFAEGEKQISRFLLGTTLPKYLSQLGTHYRLVAVQPEKVTDYQTVPDQKLPAFAVVVSMRDPGFAKTTTALVKSAALAVGTQASLKPWEEEIAGAKAFGFSFPGGGRFPDDPLGARFNYQPAFAAVQDQYVLASNKGLLRDLIGIIEKEDRSRPISQNMRTRFYASALGDYANLAPEQSLAGTIIAQGLPVAEARKQTEALFAYLQRLGTVQMETDYAPNQFRFDLTWKTRK